MPGVLTQLLRPVRPVAANDKPAMSDEECLRRLKLAVDEHDVVHLEEVARLIGQLAATIE